MAICFKCVVGFAIQVDKGNNAKEGFDKKISEGLAFPREYLDNYNIQKRMNKQSGFNAKQINKDKNPESKNRLKINSKIRSYHNKNKNR